jgi:D-alanine-D-alanine ligase
MTVSPQIDDLRSRRIAVLMGGKSGEREVSLRSGAGVLSALQEGGFDAVAVDPNRDLAHQLEAVGATAVYNALHGGAGEDGTIQGVLEMLGVPYTGCGVLASALTMNKVQTKRILGAAGLPVCDYVYVTLGDDAQISAEEIIDRLGLPLVLKPNNEGSSLGVTIPKTPAQVQADLQSLLADYGEALAEQYLRGTEITIGIVGAGSATRALPVLELVPHNEFYDYEAKYTKGLTDMICPARIPDEVALRARELALAAHKVTGCSGVSRVDMHIDAQERLWIHEINTVPGMTETSDLPHAAAAEGTGYGALVLEILGSAALRLKEMQ